ncbi:MAG: hypothetical protein J6P45_09450 [Lachnospiraceae bacterium]|nr:hypothetical protein [Lachnospiraceae bacterium]
MELNREVENKKAEAAKEDAAKRESFLSESETHILRLASRILKKSIDKSDDEYSIALIATSEALDGYEPGKGDFWGYAAFVIKSRLYDMYRKEGRHMPEVSVSPDTFSGELEEDDAQSELKLKIRDKLSDSGSFSENPVKDEIEALRAELDHYGISFFDIDKSPRTASTRNACARIIRAVFLPPPLVKALKKTGLFPAKDVMEREKVSRKLIDKYRKYLITATLILDGDYPILTEYVRFLKPGNDEKVITFEERMSS